jgi:hypothetical protein
MLCQEIGLQNLRGHSIESLPYYEVKSLRETSVYFSGKGKLEVEESLKGEYE